MLVLVLLSLLAVQALFSCIHLCSYLGNETVIVASYMETVVVASYIEQSLGLNYCWYAWRSVKKLASWMNTLSIGLQEYNDQAYTAR